MQDLEKRSVTDNKDIKTWKQYVDDVLATVKKDKTDDILHTINNTTENIRFTKEEHNNQIALLGIYPKTAIKTFSHSRQSAIEINKLDISKIKYRLPSVKI